MINAAEQFQQTVTDDCKLSTVIYSVDQRKKKEWESLIVFSVGGGGGGGVMVVVVMVVVWANTVRQLDWIWEQDSGAFFLFFLKVSIFRP